jgi:hypothetical protein
MSRGQTAVEHGTGPRVSPEPGTAEHPARPGRREGRANQPNEQAGEFYVTRPGNLAEAGIA